MLDKTDALVAMVSAVSGSGATLAVARFFVVRWIEQREKTETTLRRRVEEVAETCETRCNTSNRELASAKEEVIREYTLRLEAARIEGMTARDELRKHFDMEFTRMSDVNHDLRRDMGIWMNKVEMQGKQMDKVAETLSTLSDRVGEGTTAVRELAARLEGAGLLRRTSDRT